MIEVGAFVNGSADLGELGDIFFFLWSLWLYVRRWVMAMVMAMAMALGMRASEVV